jgi:hypothetical protein
MRRVALLSLVLLAIEACGKSKEAQAYDQLQKDCEGLVAAGATLHDADLLLQSSTYFSGTVCASTLVSMGSGDVCGPGGAYPEVCHVDWAWYPADPGVCNAIGCWLGCEARATATDYQAHGPGAKVCASRWYSHNPAPAF